MLLHVELNNGELLDEINYIDCKLIRVFNGKMQFEFEEGSPISFKLEIIKSVERVKRIGIHLVENARH